VKYYDNLVVTGSLSVTGSSSVTDGTLEFEQPTGFIFDTGASTSIHSGTNVQFPNDLTKDGHGKRVNDGALVVVSGSSLLDGGWPAFMNITASATDKVAVQNHDDTSNKPGPYYLNTGIAPFLEYDIVYNLDGGTLTLVPASAPVPEIDPAGFGNVLAVLAAALGLVEQRRRQNRCGSGAPKNWSARSRHTAVTVGWQPGRRAEKPASRRHTRH
jgi:hypothetical protein